MPEMTSAIWIAACAHVLQRQWRSVDPAQLEEVAGELWENDKLRAMPPEEAAAHWLRPVAHAS